MTSAQDNDELARLDPQKHRDDDVATQRAATAKERAHRKNRKRKERIKRNYSERPEPHGIKMGQLRRWMMNEQRKEDKGGITQEGFYALSAWSKEPAGGGRIILASDAEQGKDRFMAEWEAALKEQGTSNELVDWWEGLEMGPHGGISGDMVLRGPKLSGCEVKDGCRSSSMTLEQVPRGGSEESGADLDAEGGVRF